MSSQSDRPPEQAPSAEGFRSLRVWADVRGPTLPPPLAPPLGPAWAPRAGSQVKVFIAQSRPTLCETTDGSPPGSSVHTTDCHSLLQGVFPTQGSNLAKIAGRFFSLGIHITWEPERSSLTGLGWQRREPRVRPPPAPSPLDLGARVLTWAAAATRAPLGEARLRVSSPACSWQEH